MSWLQAQWQAFLASFDPEETADAGSGPLSIMTSVGALSLVLVVAGYVPPVANIAQFKMPEVCLALGFTGGVCTLTAWRFRCRGLIGGLATLFDNIFYCASLALAAVTSSNGFDIAFAVVLGLMVTAFPAQVYGFSLLLGVGLTAPPVALMLLFRPAPAVMAIMVCSCIMVLLLMYQTTKRHEVARGARRLEIALGETDRVLDATMQRALTTTLLNLGNFLHELRNVQTAVRMNLEFLKEQPGLGKDLGMAVHEALDASRTEQVLIDETIEDLRRQARPGSGTIILDEVVRDAIESTGTKPEISLRGSCPGFEIAGEPGHLSSVLRNLLRNAKHAGASRIEIELKLEPNGAAVQLVVQDDGPGIPKERLPRLFQPFISSSKVAGTGLGLYLSRRYVELMHGTIEADNVSGGGARFRIRLPGRIAAARDSLSLEARTVGNA